MKIVFLFPLVVLALAQTNLVSLNSECPQQFVADLNKICIRPEYIEGCLLYKSTNECQQCSKDYELVNGICSILDENSINQKQLVGCLKEVDGRCLNCANGFRKVDEKCLAGVKECAEYKEDGSCLFCNEEYSLMHGQCRHNLLLGCKYQLSDHRCAECYPPFELHSYTCVIKDCKSYNDFGCFSCECGFYITQNRACKKYDNGCLKYYRGICTECLPHFKLKGGVCTIEGCLQHQNHQCSACKQGYDLVDGVCQFKNCFDWVDDRCLICNEGYHLSEGKCVEATEKFVCSG